MHDLEQAVVTRGLPVGTVKSRISRGRARLAPILSRTARTCRAEQSIDCFQAGSICHARYRAPAQALRGTYFGELSS